MRRLRRTLPAALPWLLLVTACGGDAPADLPPISSTPLAARSAADGTRFQRLDPTTSGVAFTNLLRRENVVPYVYSGAGVAVGDYDQDGLPDLYLVSQDGPNRLYRQVAPLRFEDVTAAAGGLDGGDAWGTAATFVDIDNDGDLDLYVCNLESPNLLYLNQGNGTFREDAGRFGLAAIGACTGAAFADYDNDGDLDLYLLTNRVFGPQLPTELIAEVTLPRDFRKTREELTQPAFRPLRQDGELQVDPSQADFYFTFQGQVFNTAQRDRLLRNDGYAQWHDVTFQAGVQHQGSGLSATWWDLDGDGWLDLYVGNDLESADRLYRNRRDGTFEEIAGQALPQTAYFGMGGDFGDIDNDGRLEFCIADMSSTSHYMGKMLMGNMDEKRWFLMNSAPPQVMRNAVFLNTGTGRFAEIGHLAGLASTDWTWAVRFADLDNDGRLDFFASNGIALFEDNPDSVAEFRRLWRSGQKAQALALARAIEPVRERNVARRNTGGLRFADVGAAWGLDEPSVGQGAVIADLDRDGDLDIVVNNQNQPASIFANRGHDGRAVLVSLHGTRSNRHGVGATITLQAAGLLQTRLVSLSRGYMGGHEAVEHFGLGDAARIEWLRVRWPSGFEQEFRDLPTDRHFTIAETGPAAPPRPAPVLAPHFRDLGGLPARHQEQPFDDYALQPLLPHRLSRLGPGLACGDVDGDGRDDLFVGGAAGQPGVLLRNLGDGRTEPLPGPWADDAAGEDLGALLFDADGDADLDLYVVSGGIEHGERTELLRDRLYRNDGKGTFTRADDALPDLRHSGAVVCAADFDRDGDLDLLVGGRTIAGRFPHAPPSALLRNDGGRFTDATAALLPALADAGMVTAALWADLDGDGWQDLVLAAQWRPLRVFRNEQGAFREITNDLGLGATSGQWFGLAAADLDGDGDLDLIAGNLGTNTKYKADPAHPLRLYADDFDQNGVLDVVEAKQSGDQVLPVRGRSCSSQAMPFLAEKFRTFDAFARATLPEIYGSDALGRCLELRCDELRSLVLRNDGATFTTLPLPPLAQVAPVQGIGVLDADGDGVLDLLLAQNSFSPEPETGRFGGGLGLLLRGLGDATFEAVPAWRSGIVLPGDHKALAVLDVDGDARPDVAVSTNDGPVRLLCGTGRDGNGLAVRLRGGPGNPTGIGARIELVGADGRRHLRTIDGGGGYLSQSAPVAFFASVPADGRLRVRWPDGQITEQAAPGAGGGVVIGR